MNEDIDEEFQKIVRRDFITGLASVAAAGTGTYVGLRDYFNSSNRYEFEWTNEQGEEELLEEYLQRAETIQMGGDEIYAVPSMEMTHERGDEVEELPLEFYVMDDRDPKNDELVKQVDASTGESFSLSHSGDSYTLELEDSWYDGEGDLHAILEKA